MGVPDDTDLAVKVSNLNGIVFVKNGQVIQFLVHQSLLDFHMSLLEVRPEVLSFVVVDQHFSIL